MATHPSVQKYMEEMKASREELMAKITMSSEEIAGRCEEAMAEATTEVSELFDEKERERVVQAYAEKLRVSRDEMMAKMEARMKKDREKVVADIKMDVKGIVEAVLEKYRVEMERARQKSLAEAEKRRKEEIRRITKEQHDEMRRFCDATLANVKAQLAQQREDAMNKYKSEMDAYYAKVLSNADVTHELDLDEDTLKSPYSPTDGGRADADRGHQSEALTPPRSSPSYS